MLYVHFVQVIVFEDCLMFVKKVTSLSNVIVKLKNAKQYQPTVFL